MRFKTISSSISRRCVDSKLTKIKRSKIRPRESPKRRLRLKASTTLIKMRLTRVIFSFPTARNSRPNGVLLNQQMRKSPKMFKKK